MDPDSQRLWATILVICASLLLALFLLLLAMGWRKQFSKWLLLGMLLSLVGSVAMAFVAHHFFDTYAFYTAFLDSVLHGRHVGPYLKVLDQDFVRDEQQATVLGWIGVSATGVVLALDVIGMGRLRGRPSR